MKPEKKQNFYTWEKGEKLPKTRLLRYPTSGTSQKKTIEKAHPQKQGSPSQSEIKWGQKRMPSVSPTPGLLAQSSKQSFPGRET